MLHTLENYWELIVAVLLVLLACVFLTIAVIIGGGGEPLACAKEMLHGHASPGPVEVLQLEGQEMRYDDRASACGLWLVQ